MGGVVGGVALGLACSTGALRGVRTSSFGSDNDGSLGASFFNSGGSNGAADLGFSGAATGRLILGRDNDGSSNGDSFFGGGGGVVIGSFFASC